MGSATSAKPGTCPRTAHWRKAVLEVISLFPAVARQERVEKGFGKSKFLVARSAWETPIWRAWRQNPLRHVGLVHAPAQQVQKVLAWMLLQVLVQHPPWE